MSYWRATSHDLGDNEISIHVLTLMRRSRFARVLMNVSCMTEVIPLEASRVRSDGIW